MALEEHLLDRENPASSGLLRDQHRLLEPPERLLDFLGPASNPVGEGLLVLAGILDEEMVDPPVQVFIFHVYSFHEYQNIVFFALWKTFRKEIVSVCGC